ncbi:12671_t:CDS:2, partial [Racocetra persica]
SSATWIKEKFNTKNNDDYEFMKALGLLEALEVDADNGNVKATIQATSANKESQPANKTGAHKKTITPTASSTLKTTLEALHNACLLKVSREVNNNYNTEQKNDRESSPPIKHAFSFIDEEQGAFIEPILNLVERALNEVLIENQHMISSKVVEIFNIKIFDKSAFHGQHKSTPTELFKNYKNNVRNK